MHIATLLHRFAGGGAEKAALLVSKGFVEQGHQVTFLVNEKSGAYLERASEEFSVRVIGNTPFLKQYRLIQNIRQQRYDVMFSFLMHRQAGMMTTAGLAGTPTIPVVQNNLWRNLQLQPLFKRIMNQAVWSMEFHTMDQFIAVSEGVRDTLLEHFHLPDAEVDVVHNPIDLTRIQRLGKQKPDDIKGVQRWYDAEHRLISVGRLNAQKNQRLLLAAFDRVRKAVSDASLLLLGEGELRPELEREIRDRGLGDAVFLPGFTSNPYYFLCKADLFVLSSNFEGFPLVLIESISCGTDIVSTDCPSGPRELIGDRSFGTLVPVGDAGRLSSAVRRSLQAPSPPEEHLRGHAQRFSYRNISSQYLDLV